MRKILLSTVVVFIVWAILGFLFHGILLKGLYDTAPVGLFRQMADMKMWLSYLVSLVLAGVFCSIYAYFISEKSMKKGLYYGLFLGFGYGLGMGYGTYATMPLPYSLALCWFLITIFEYGVAGLLVGLIVKK